MGASDMPTVILDLEYALSTALTGAYAVECLAARPFASDRTRAAVEYVAGKLVADLTAALALAAGDSPPVGDDEPNDAQG